MKPLYQFFLCVKNVNINMELEGPNPPPHHFPSELADLEACGGHWGSTQAEQGSFVPRLQMPTCTDTWRSPVSSQTLYNLIIAGGESKKLTGHLQTDL
jgi:hypothetical protein